MKKTKANSPYENQNLATLQEPQLLYITIK